MSYYECSNTYTRKIDQELLMVLIGTCPKTYLHRFFFSKCLHHTSYILNSMLLFSCLVILLMMIYMVTVIFVQEPGYLTGGLLLPHSCSGSLSSPPRFGRSALKNGSARGFALSPCRNPLRTSGACVTSLWAARVFTVGRVPAAR